MNFKVIKALLTYPGNLKDADAFLAIKNGCSVEEILQIREFLKSRGISRNMKAEEVRSIVLNSEELTALVRSGRESALTTPVEKENLKPEVEIEGDSRKFTFYIDSYIADNNELLARLNLNPKEFEVVRSYFKTKGDGYNVTVLTKPRIGSVETARATGDLASILTNISPLPIPTELPTVKGGRISVLCLFDAHLGKVAHEAYTGNSTDLENTVLDIALHYANLRREIIAKQPTEVILPIGNDFFNVDDTRLSTTRGTPQDNTKNLYEVYSYGLNFYSGIIKDLAAFTNVKVVLVPGNHCEYSEMVLAVSLKKLFENFENVEVDDRPIQRKYFLLGKTCLGLGHGTLKPSQYAALLPFEAKEFFSQANYFEFLCGDKHHNKTANFIPPTLEIDGIIVRNLSSTSKTDEWHFNSGYSLSYRMSYVLTYNTQKGIEGIYHSIV